MKCDELEKFDAASNADLSAGYDHRYAYEADDVDAAIEELREEILNLKAKNIELQSFYDLHGNVDNYIDKLEAENVKLKQKLENVQASMYADVVDANMEVRRLKEMMPEYKQFIKDEKFKKELVDEYDGYVYEWMGHRYIATPYINLFIKGILRALWLARAERANESHFMWCQFIYDKNFGIVKFNVRKEWGENVKQGQTLHTPQGWADVWEEVERKCLKKAEEY